MFNSGSAMLWGGAKELNPAWSFCHEAILELETGAFTGNPEASFSPGPDPRPSSQSRSQECA